MKCENCGEEILSGNKCENCGFERQNNQINNNQVQNYNNEYNQNTYNRNNTQNYAPDDKKSGMAVFISFLLPQAGLVLYFLNRRKKPQFAKSFKTGFLARIILAIILGLFSVVIITLLFVLIGVAIENGILSI